MKVVVRLVVLTAVMAWSVVAVAPAAAQTYPPYPPYAPAAPVQPAPILGQHTAAAGDTLDCIGRVYQVEPGAIAQANGTSTITAGQVVKIPGVAWLNIPPLPPNTTCTTQPQFNMPAGWPILGKHTVQPNEWIYSIARTYKVNPMAIAQASGIPGPYTPVCGGCGWYAHPTPYGGCGTCGGYYGGCGTCGGYYGGCGGYYGGCGCCGGPWNFVYPGQVLTIPGVWWFNMPAGPTVTPQTTTVKVPW